MLLEPCVAALAASRANPDQLQRLWSRLEAIHAAERWLDYKEALYLTIGEIYALTGNGFLAAIFDVVLSARRESRFDGLNPDEPVSLIVINHTYEELRIMLAAVESGDPGHAERAMRNFVTRMFAL